MIKSKSQKKFSFAVIGRYLLIFLVIILMQLFVRLSRIPTWIIIVGIFSVFLFMFTIGIVFHLIEWRKAKKLGFAEEKKGNYVFLIVFIVSFGLIFSGIGISMQYFQMKKERRCSQSSLGIVVDYYVRTRAKGKSYYPIVEFKVKDKKIQATFNVAGSYKNYRIGEEIAIRYNPQKPKEFLIEKEKNVVPLLFIVFGVYISTAFIILILTQFDGKRMKLETEKKDSNL